MSSSPTQNPPKAPTPTDNPLQRVRDFSSKDGRMPTFETWSSATTCLILGVWLSVLLTVPLLILLVQTLHRVTHVAQTLDEILPANVTHSQLDVLKTQRLIRLYA